MTDVTSQGLGRFAAMVTQLVSNVALLVVPVRRRHGMIELVGKVGGSVGCGSLWGWVR